MTTHESQPAALTELRETHARMKAELSQVIVGQDEVIDQLLLAVLTRGHCLLEGVPGLAKTLSAKTLATLLRVDFSRIQFTPDLLPSDVIGMSILDSERKEFVFKPGPIFAHGLCDDPGIFFITEK